MSRETTSLQHEAREALSWFEQATRDDHSEYWRLSTGPVRKPPEWVNDLVYVAHDNGAMLPDDWKYSCIVSALQCLAEADDPEDAAHEWADAEVDVYDGARTAWLASHLSRANYCDDAVEEMYAVGDRPGIIEAIGCGQYQEAREVYGLVWGALSLRVENVSA